MNKLELKIPPPVVAIAVGAIMWGLSRAGIGAASAGGSITAAAVIALIGLGIALSGNVAFHRARTTVNPFKPETASSLVTSGIYRFTRNPMYLGMFVALVGWAVFLANLLSAMTLLLFPLYITRFQIQPEERALLSLFGEPYASYMTRVRRWL